MDETPIEIVPYDPEWRERFRAERERLDSWLAPHTIRIEHVGSTSVPGLAAKPIVDITAVVSDLRGLWGDVDKLNEALGYELTYLPRDWLLLQRTDDAERGYNLHLVPEESEQWRHDLLFREYLRANGDAREEYAATKRDAAAEHSDNIAAYNAAKSDICGSILDAALTDESIAVPDPER